MADKMINFYVSEKDIKEMDAKSKELGVKRSKFIRDAVKNAVEEKHDHAKDIKIAALEAQVEVYKELLTTMLKKTIASEIREELTNKLGSKYWEKIED